MGKNTDKRISNNKLDKMIGSSVEKHKDIEYLCEDGSKITIKIKPRIPYNEVAAIVLDVSNSVFSDDDNMRYFPFIKQCSLISNILRYYTDLPYDMDVDKIEKLRCSDLYNTIMDNLDYSQILEIETAIDEVIEFKKQEILSIQKARLEENIKEISELINVFNKMGEKFGDVDLNVLMDSISKISQHDEKEIVNSILDYKAIAEEAK